MSEQYHEKGSLTSIESGYTVPRIPGKAPQPAYDPAEVAAFTKQQQQEEYEPETPPPPPPPAGPSSTVEDSGATSASSRRRIIATTVTVKTEKHGAGGGDDSSLLSPSLETPDKGKNQHEGGLSDAAGSKIDPNELIAELIGLVKNKDEEIKVLRAQLANLQGAMTDLSSSVSELKADKKLLSDKAKAEADAAARKKEEEEEKERARRSNMDGNQRDEDSAMGTGAVVEQFFGQGGPHYGPGGSGGMYSPVVAHRDPNHLSTSGGGSYNDSTVRLVAASPLGNQLGHGRYSGGTPQRRDRSHVMSPRRGGRPPIDGQARTGSPISRNNSTHTVLVVGPSVGGGIGRGTGPGGAPDKKQVAELLAEEEQRAAKIARAVEGARRRALAQKSKGSNDKDPEYVLDCGNFRTKNSTAQHIPAALAHGRHTDEALMTKMAEASELTPRRQVELYGAVARPSGPGPASYSPLYNRKASPSKLASWK